MYEVVPELIPDFLNINIREFFESSNFKQVKSWT